MAQRTVEDLTDEELLYHIEKSNHVGCLVEYGFRLKSAGNPAEAYKYFSMAYEQGNHLALLQMMYIVAASEVEVSDEEKFRVVKASSDYWSGYSSFVLAYYYRDGIGTEVNIDKFFELLEICASEGSLYAASELARCYENGINTPQSYEKAFDIYYNWYDDHGKPDMFFMYKCAYYMYHELGGAKKDLEVIRYYLKRSGRWEEAARKLYKEIFNEEWEDEKR